MTEKGRKYCSDILRAIDLIAEFTVEISEYNDYLSDGKTQSAVERQLGIVGEALNSLLKAEPHLKIENQEKIIGLRNRLIHSYDGIDPSIVWVIMHRYLPKLKNEVEAICVN